MRYMFTLLVIGGSSSFLVHTLNAGEESVLLETVVSGESVQDDVGGQDGVVGNWKQYVQTLGQNVANQFLWSFFMSPAATIVGKERKSGNSDFKHVLQAPELNSFVRDEVIKIKQLIQQRIRERIVDIAPGVEHFLNAFTAANIEQ